jgi:adenylate cyclase
MAHEETPENRKAPPEAWALTRERAVIVFVDVVESMKIIAHNERLGVERIRALLARCMVETTANAGRVLEEQGDGLVLRFELARNAVLCALRFHEFANENSQAHPQEPPLALRAGVNKSDLLVDARHVYGQGMNLTARISALAKEGETTISAAAKDDLAWGIEFEGDDLGECYLRHVEMPVHVYRVRKVGAASPFAVPGRANIDEPIMPKLAMMPLEAVGDHETVVATDALSDEISLALSRMPTLRLISRFSMKTIAAAQPSLDVLRTRLGAHYVLNGRVRQTPAGLQLSYELVATATGEVVAGDGMRMNVGELWADAAIYTTPVCEKVTTAIAADGFAAANSKPMPNVASHELLGAAIVLMHRGSASTVGRTEVVLQELMDRHKRHPSPYAWAAKQRLLKIWQNVGGARRQDIEMARQYADQAIGCAAHVGLAFAVRGMISSHLDRDFSRANALYTQARSCEANEPLTWAFEATLNTFSGDGPNAIGCASRAIELSPFDPIRYYYLTVAAGAHVANGTNSDAINLAQRALKLNDTHASTLRILALAQALNGDCDAGQRTMRRLLLLDPDFTVSSYISHSPAVRAKEYGNIFKQLGAKA